MEINGSRLFTGLKDKARALAEVKLELLRLEALEKSSTLSSLLIYGVIVVNLAFFALLFAFIALGLTLGAWLRNVAGGFALVALLYLLLLGLMVCFRKALLTCVANLFLRILDPRLDGEMPVSATVPTDAACETPLNDTGHEDC
jgi:amino acid transporter